MPIYGYQILQVPSDLADAIVEQYRIHNELLEAFRAGDLLKSQQLAIELVKADQRRGELTPPPGRR